MFDVRDLIENSSFLTFSYSLFAVEFSLFFFGCNLVNVALISNSRFFFLAVFRLSDALIMSIFQRGTESNVK